MRYVYGEDVTTMIIDSHFHLGRYPSYLFYDVSVKNYLRRMDRMGIGYCISTNLRGLCGDIRGGVEEDRRAYEESNGRIMSYFVFDPCFGRLCIDLMEKNYDRKVFKGIKLHPSFHLTYADDPAYEIAWEYARDMKLPIISHTWEISATNNTQKYSYPPLFEKYIEKYDDVTFICGHTGGKFDGIQQCVKLMKNYANVYSDTAGDVYYNRFPEYIVKEVGSERLLYGSDAFMIDCRTQLGMILDADMQLKDKENILYRNAERIFGLKA